MSKSEARYVVVPKFDWDRGVHEDYRVPAQIVERFLAKLMTTRRWEQDQEHFFRMWKLLKKEMAESMYRDEPPLQAEPRPLPVIPEIEVDENDEVVEPVTVVPPVVAKNKGGRPRKHPVEG